MRSRVQVALPQEDILRGVGYIIASCCAEKPLLARDRIIQEHVVNVGGLRFVCTGFILNHEVRIRVRCAVLLEAHDSWLPTLSGDVFRVNVDRSPNEEVWLASSIVFVN